MSANSNILVLMTALPPTRGHGYLIDFAYAIANQIGADVEILINTRDCEPFVEDRVDAVKSYFGKPVHHYHGEVPQNPSEHPDFWGIWKGLIRSTTNNKPDDIVIASEHYGAKLAEVLECRFIPCDIGREVINISGTRVRQNPLMYFDQILPTMQPYFRKTVTFFGQESVGKTTQSNTWENLFFAFLPTRAAVVASLYGGVTTPINFG